MTMDALSLEIEQAAQRVRAVQRKRFAVSALSVGVAGAIIVAGEALIVLGIAGMRSGQVSAMVFALPFAAGLPPAWALRNLLWPKDPVI
jgi:hypothetical protein